MPNLQIAREGTSLTGGNGVVEVAIRTGLPGASLTPGDIIDLTFRPFGSEPLCIGSGTMDTLSLKAGIEATVRPIFKEATAQEADTLEDLGASKYFEAEANAGQVLALLRIGANASLSVNQARGFGAVSVKADLEAGDDASYSLLRPYLRRTSVEDLIRDLLRAIRLPAEVRQIAAGEVVVLEYGGGLRFGTEIRAGYQISGSPSVELGQLTLSEPYSLSLTSALSLHGALAGRFRVEVRAAAEKGWANVTVRKSRTSSLGIAADLAVGASAEPDGLPETPHEFLGALLGMRVQSWLHLLEQVQDYTDFETLDARLDTLAKAFVERVSGQAFGALAQDGRLDQLLAKLKRVVTAYTTLDDRVMALFDRILDPATAVMGKPYEEALRTLAGLESWAPLQGRVDPKLWAVVQALTGGDPLAALIEKSVEALSELTQRATQTLALAQHAHYSELREVVRIARQDFPLEGLLSSLQSAPLDAAWLKSLADRRLAGLVERLLGQAVGAIKDNDLGQAVGRLHQALDSVAEFEQKAYAKLLEALRQKLESNLHAAYRKDDAAGVLLDFDVDLASPHGAALMRTAGRGDFTGLLEAHRSGAARLRAGLLTNQATRTSTLSVNVAGRHRTFSYEAMDRLLVQAEQRIEVDAAGDVAVFTAMELDKELERKRNGERLYTRLLLAFLGQSAGAVTLDPREERFLVDRIETITARYELVLNDPSTTEQELAQYLSFADDFGLASSDEAARAALEPLLPRDDHGGFGEVSVSYDVRFTPEGLRGVFGRIMGPSDEQDLRRIMRTIVLASALNRSEVERSRAWAYWTPGVYARYLSEGPNFSRTAGLRFPVAPAPFKNLTAPRDGVVLNEIHLRILYTLYQIEDSLVEGMRLLTGLVAAGGPQQEGQYQRALLRFGKALSAFDGFDASPNTIFALLDQLIRLRSPSARRSTLTLRSKVGDATFSTVLVA